MMRKMLFGALVLLPLLVLAFTPAQPVGATGGQPPPTPTAPAPTGPPADIPIYPGATLQQQYGTPCRGMTMGTWTYMVSGPHVAASDVITFYETQMPTHGWASMMPPPPTAKGTVMLMYMRQPMMGTPGPGPGRMPRMAMITIGPNTQATPPHIGVVITEMGMGCSRSGI